MQVVMEHRINETDIAIVTTPWYHMVAPDTWLYPHFVASATAVLHAKFEPGDILESLEEHDATVLPSGGENGSEYQLTSSVNRRTRDSDLKTYYQWSLSKLYKIVDCIARVRAHNLARQV